MLRPTLDEVMTNVIASFDDIIRPDVTDQYASSIALTLSNLLRHVKVRARLEPEALWTDNADLRELLGRLGVAAPPPIPADVYPSIERLIDEAFALRTALDGFIADRLMEALWREALWLVNDGVATAEEIDDAMRFGPGLRWSFIGTFLIYRIAGGEPGMRHFMAQFGPALKWPWTKLMDVPELTDELLTNARVVGVTAGASAPEELVDEVIAASHAPVCIAA